MQIGNAVPVDGARSAVVSGSRGRRTAARLDEVGV